MLVIANWITISPPRITLGFGLPILYHCGLNHQTTPPESLYTFAISFTRFHPAVNQYSQSDWLMVLTLKRFQPIRTSPSKMNMRTGNLCSMKDGSFMTRNVVVSS